MLVVLVQEVTARVQGADQQRLSVCLLVGRFVGQNELKTTLLVTRAIVRRCGVSVCVNILRTPTFPSLELPCLVSLSRSLAAAAVYTHTAAVCLSTVFVELFLRVIHWSVDCSCALL